MSPSTRNTLTHWVNASAKNLPDSDAEGKEGESENDKEGDSEEGKKDVEGDTVKKDEFTPSSYSPSSSDAPTCESQQNNRHPYTTPKSSPSQSLDTPSSQASTKSVVTALKETIKQELVKASNEKEMDREEAEKLQTVEPPATPRPDFCELVNVKVERLEMDVNVSGPTSLESAQSSSLGRTSVDTDTPTSASDTCSKEKLVGGMITGFADNMNQISQPYASSFASFGECNQFVTDLTVLSPARELAPSFYVINSKPRIYCAETLVELATGSSFASSIHICPKHIRHIR
ncbi:hypothetical protein BDQ17DRAFT_1425166 [Cyathus striatus]|nr:hypothetical protein BDQ17DRAFT_1425166 [Cyathus striatus]